MKYRLGDDIVIVIRRPRVLDPQLEAEGDVFTRAEHLGAKGFPAATDHVAALAAP